LDGPAARRVPAIAVWSPLIGALSGFRARPRPASDKRAAAAARSR
jgi:hypothetical protein